jgi:hypothetical protein
LRHGVTTVARKEGGVVKGLNANTEAIDAEGCERFKEGWGACGWVKFNGPLVTLFKDHKGRLAQPLKARFAKETRGAPATVERSQRQEVGLIGLARGKEGCDVSVNLQGSNTRVKGTIGTFPRTKRDVQIEIFNVSWAVHLRVASDHQRDEIIL